MRDCLILAGSILALNVLPACAIIDEISGGLTRRQAALSEAKIISGLKEALKIGAEKAVERAARTDGYFANPAIQIQMPRELRRMETALRAVGFGSQVDGFVLSMNRAAERAAPSARQIFWEAIAGMNFDDPRGILAGGDAAATEYFKSRAGDRVAAAYRPAVQRAATEAGTAGKYHEMIERYKEIPFVPPVSFDLEAYVVKEALDGLFTLMGEEERRIRTDPKARVTDLLQEIFGK